ncbi:hypothetical protein L1049_009201 [Liquidambar formosana]|uniref:Small auxin up regulated protein n=1 Tax=Liquidambar formosana TaxID=63359 RepID=A0AAP0S4X7_LIQFO
MASIKHLRCEGHLQHCEAQKNGLRVAQACQSWQEETTTRCPSRISEPVAGGETSRRFVIRADYLNHPLFKQLLDLAYDKYGHKKNGPLAIPCDEFVFQDIIHPLRGGMDASQITCHEAGKKGKG